jgi:hypothetical protein
MPRRKRSENKRPISRKDKLFVQGVASGKTDKAAAMAAGYGQATAENTKARLWSKPAVLEYFKTLMRTAAPPERLVRRISDLIDGKSIVTKIRKRTVPSTDPKKSGEETEETVIERTESVDAAVSLRAVELAVQYAEYAPEKAGVQVAVSMTLEEAMIQNGNSWEPPSWAKPLAGAEL